MLFFFNSGSTLTVINNLSLIKFYTSFKQSRFINTAGGHRLRIHSSGYIDGIGEVFYVPESKKNLIPISQLTKNGSSITFTNDKVFIDSIEIGTLDNKLYVLNRRPDVEVLHS